MSARYWVMASDELMNHADLRWPDGLRPVERGGTIFPGMRWWLFQDDAASEDLDGKEVDLTLRLVRGLPRIARRLVLA